MQGDKLRSALASSPKTKPLNKQAPAPMQRVSPGIYRGANGNLVRQETRSGARAPRPMPQQVAQPVAQAPSQGFVTQPTNMGNYTNEQFNSILQSIAGQNAQPYGPMNQGMQNLGVNKPMQTPDLQQLPMYNPYQQMQPIGKPMIMDQATQQFVPMQKPVAPQGQPTQQQMLPYGNVNKFY